MPEPKSLRLPACVAEREEMLLVEPTVQELRDWAARMAIRRGAHVPSFDPAEGGDESRVLFVLEAPGPATNALNVRAGSGFISIDNNDGTAAEVWRARDAAGLHRGVLSWNIVPWYLGVASRKPTKDELREGAAELIEVLRILPQVEVVILGGLFARRGWAAHITGREPSQVKVVETWHPSPLAMKQAGKREQFHADFATVAGIVASNR